MPRARRPGPPGQRGALQIYVATRNSCSRNSSSWAFALIIRASLPEGEQFSPRRPALKVRATFLRRDPGLNLYTKAINMGVVKASIEHADGWADIGWWAASAGRGRQALAGWSSCWASRLLEGTGEPVTLRRWPGRSSGRINTD